MIIFTVGIPLDEWFDQFRKAGNTLRVQDFSPNMSSVILVIRHVISELKSHVGDFDSIPMTAEDDVKTMSKRIDEARYSRHLSARIVVLGTKQFASDADAIIFKMQFQDYIISSEEVAS